MKIANIDREILHIFWTAWESSMKISENMWLMIILTFTKNQGFNPYIEDTFFEKAQGGVKLTFAAVSRLRNLWNNSYIQEDKICR